MKIYEAVNRYGKPVYIVYRAELVRGGYKAKVKVACFFYEWQAKQFIKNYFE